jgi:hypothetical protein
MSEYGPQCNAVRQSVRQEETYGLLSVEFFSFLSNGGSIMRLVEERALRFMSPSSKLGDSDRRGLGPSIDKTVRRSAARMKL